MSQCLKCGLEFGDQTPDYCPVCHTICYLCPWCGRMTDASQPQCSLLDCGRPIKYLRMTPDLRDVMRLGKDQVIQIDHAEVTIERALYSSQRVTVYRGQVTNTKGWRPPEPKNGDVVVVREVMDEMSPRIQAVATKLKSIRHPNIVRTYGVAPDAERCCYLMLQSWAGDRTLAFAYLQDEGGQLASNVEVGRIALALSKAVEYLHSRGIIHCDITPFNVLLMDDGTPVLSDFGLATLTDDPGQAAGYTAHYAPIEMYPREEIPSNMQVRISPLGTHTDRYMLGATIFAMATGYDGRQVHPVTRTPVLVPPVERIKYDQGLDGSPQTPIVALRPDIDHALAQWIETLISIEPEKRFKHDSEMLKRIKKASRKIGRRRRIPIPNFRRLRKAAKVTAIAFGFFAFTAVLKHPYSVTHSPANLPVLAMSDLASLFGADGLSMRILNFRVDTTADTVLTRGRILEQKGHLERALEAYKEALTMDPQFTSAKRAAEHARSQMGLACIQRGLQLYRSGEYYLASKQLTQAMHYGAVTVDGCAALARISERRGDLAAAASYYDKVCALEPAAVKPHYKASLLYLDSGNLEKAYHHAAKARDLHFTPKPQNDIDSEDMQDLLDEVSGACLQAGNLDISLAKNSRRIYDKMVWVNRAKNLQPDAEVYTRLGRFYERLGDISAGDRRINHYSQSAEHLQKARKLNSGSGTINTLLARVTKKLDRLE